MLGLLLVAQLAARSSDPARAQLVLRSAGEVVLAGAIAANVLVIGAASAATGRGCSSRCCRTGRSSSPPTRSRSRLYLRGRRRALPAAGMAVVACASVALLALAAALETWVSL